MSGSPHSDASPLPSSPSAPTTPQPQPQSNPLEAFCVAHALSPAATRIFMRQFRRTPTDMLPQLTVADLIARMSDAKAMLESEKHAPPGSDQSATAATLTEDNPFDADSQCSCGRRTRGWRSQANRQRCRSARCLTILMGADLSLVAVSGPPSRFAFTRAPWFHLCRALLVVLLYYTSLSLDLVTLIPLWHSMSDEPWYNREALEACIGGCTWTCEASYYAGTVMFVPGQSCSDACTVLWQQRYPSTPPPTMRNVTADYRSCSSSDEAFRTPGGHFGFQWREPTQWILGESRPPHADFVRYEPDILQLKGGLYSVPKSLQPPVLHLNWATGITGWVRSLFQTHFLAIVLLAILIKEGLKLILFFVLFMRAATRRSYWIHFFSKHIFVGPFWMCYGRAYRETYLSPRLANGASDSSIALRSGVLDFFVQTLPLLFINVCISLAEASVGFAVSPRTIVTLMFNSINALVTIILLARTCTRACADAKQEMKQQHTQAQSHSKARSSRIGASSRRSGDDGDHAQ